MNIIIFKTKIKNNKSIVCLINIYLTLKNYRVWDIKIIIYQEDNFKDIFLIKKIIFFKIIILEQVHINIFNKNFLNKIDKKLIS